MSANSADVGKKANVAEVTKAEVEDKSLLEDFGVDEALEDDA